MSGNRQCVRPGCGGAVAALLSYDYAGQRIWLDDPDAETGGHQSALCAAHASRLRAPKGWSCQDRRIIRAAPSFRVPGRAPSHEPRQVAPGMVDPAIPAGVTVPVGEAESVSPAPAQPPEAAPAPLPAPEAAEAEQAAAGPVPPQRDGGVIAGLTAIAV